MALRCLEYHAQQIYRGQAARNLITAVTRRDHAVLLKASYLAQFEVFVLGSANGSNGFARRRRPEDSSRESPTDSVIMKRSTPSTQTRASDAHGCKYALLMIWQMLRGTEQVWSSVRRNR